MDEKGLDLIEGDRFKYFVENWETLNTLNTYNRQYKKYFDKIDRLLLLIGGEILDKNSVIGSRLYSYFDEDIFREWYPMGMDENIWVKKYEYDRIIF